MAIKEESETELNPKSLAEKLQKLTKPQQAAFIRRLPPAARTRVTELLTTHATEQAQAGETVELLPHQRIPEPQDIQDGHVLAGGRGSGKALALHTPIPTPAGWSTMGGLRPGDVVYDECGKPARVLDVFEPDIASAYRVHFSDGTHLDACGDHLWVTHTALERKRHNRRKLGAWGRDWAAKEPVTTSHLFTTQATTPRKVSNHSIPTAFPLEGADSDILIDGWALGYWLGNGTSIFGAVTTHAEDEAGVRTLMASAGYPCAEAHANTTSPTFTPKLLVTDLKRLGVLGNKHIPKQYLRASEGVRMALLAGLMDSDGFIDAGKQIIEFCAVNNELLATQFVELARSLGQKPILAASPAKYYEKVTGTRYRVTFRPTFNPFRLPRKGNAWHEPHSSITRRRQRMITSVEPIPTEPMRCITVDSPNSMYLAGEGMIPTHNTFSAANYLARLAENTPGLRARVIAPTLADAVNSVALDPQSGILAQSPSAQFKSHGAEGARIIWPNKSTVFLVGTPTFKDVDRLRALTSIDIDHIEEAAANPQLAAAVEQAALSRRGKRIHHPIWIASTTPRPVPTYKAWLKNPRVSVSHGTTMDNPHTPDSYREYAESLKGTHLYDQEIMGNVVDDIPGALWSRANVERSIERDPDTRAALMKAIDRIVVGVDPPSGHGTCGIVVAGATTRESDPTGQARIVILDDFSVSDAGPSQWGNRVIDAAETYQAHIVAERNQGGLMVLETIQQAAESRGSDFHTVTLAHAAVSKERRAAPMALLWEVDPQRGILAPPHGDVTRLATLIDQMTSWIPGTFSPDHLDAAAWAATYLLKGGAASAPATLQPPTPKQRPVAAAWRQALMGRSRPRR